METKIKLLGLIAIRHLFFLNFHHGEMAKMARKNSQFSPFIFVILAIFAILPSIFWPFLPLWRTLNRNVQLQRS
ncbi:MAG: hypothetical protein GY820_26905 [Gammaproteobacteria bacterium]|nr:hypothetical protein [Gammaproteobacteria bacterium]